LSEDEDPLLVQAMTKNRHKRRSIQVDTEMMTERLFPLLITGDRTATRSVVESMIQEGVTPEQLTHDAYWPLLEMINTLYRNDQLTNLAHHYATRLLRNLVDQAQARYTMQPRRNKRIMLFCGATEVDDLAAQIVADLAEADGYDMAFGGGGISWDEILQETSESKPDTLLLFSSSAQDAPHIRVLIDTVRDIGACPDMQIVVGGGIFNRAEGLAEEIGADLWATTPAELIHRINTEPERRATAEQRTVGQSRAA
jgi:methanogenic corrinoid protein MtbC1